jgi:hypothetical protein
MIIGLLDGNVRSECESGRKRDHKKGERQAHGEPRRNNWLRFALAESERET